VFVSWNGSTETRRWLVQTGPTARHLRPVGVARRGGFETAIRLGRLTGHLAVSALDEADNVLSTSHAVKL
jgi:hypothetical protein